MYRCIAFMLCFLPVVLHANELSGKRLAYVVGCVNCHHQTAKDVINAPPLVMMKAYSMQEFRKLMKEGVTRAGRDMASEGSVMGFVSKEQFSHMTDQEVVALYKYLTVEWTAEQGLEEEKKIPLYFKAAQDDPE